MNFLNIFCNKKKQREHYIKNEGKEKTKYKVYVTKGLLKGYFDVIRDVFDCIVEEIEERRVYAPTKHKRKKSQFRYGDFDSNVTIKVEQVKTYELDGNHYFDEVKDSWTIPLEVVWFLVDQEFERQDREVVSQKIEKLEHKVSIFLEKAEKNEEGKIFFEP